VAGAVKAGVAAIIVLVLFEGNKWGFVRYRDFRKRHLAARCLEVTLHGMAAFENAIDRNGQHGHNEYQGKEFQRDEFLHNRLKNYAAFLAAVKTLTVGCGTAFTPGSLI
jgi:hypothetical protein